MTNKEAIVQLEIMATNLIGDIQNGNELAFLNYKTLDLAIQTLEKQIPKKLGKGDIGVYCPTCGTNLMDFIYQFGNDYDWYNCPFCGQRLEEE